MSEKPLIKRESRLPKEWGPLAILATLCIILALISPRFFTMPNLLNILMLMVIPLILAIGTHYVILTGSVDLSLEGVMAVSGVVTAMLVANSMTHLNFGIWGILAGAIVGAVLGTLNGVLYVKLKIPSFIVTLGMSLVGIGLATLLYRGNPITVRAMDMQQLVIGQFLGMPSIFWWGISFFAIMILFERLLPFTHHVLAVGGNEKVAKQAGVPIMKIKILVFTLAGFCSGLAGSLNALRLALGSSQTSAGFLFASLTAVVVGGTVLTGGRGSVLGVLVGVLIVQVITNGMILLTINPFYQQAVQGIVLVLAIAVTLSRRRTQFVK
ncbi:MAG: ABC transporter permease [Paenibacillaceae bacterium]